MNIKELIKKILPKPLHAFARKIFKISHNYKIIKNPDLNKLRKKYNNTWKNDSIPNKQLELVEKQLIDFTKVAPMKAMVELIKEIKIKNPSVLEIGCSSGHYSEVLKKAGILVKYEGCDYSPEFIKLARKRYPDINFKTSDATKLDYKDEQFDIVISGCCILHIIDYEKAISEAVRVAKNYIIFHRTPTLDSNNTTFIEKTGYNVKMMEILFNEKELMNLFNKNNLIVENINNYINLSIEGLNEPIRMKSYLCKKI